jgi:hypothetical protein
MTANRFCTDCRHAAREDDGRTLKPRGDCLHPRSMHQPPPDPVTGEQPSERRHQMTDLRMMFADELCGVDGAWFERMFASPEAQVAWADQTRD